MSEIKKVKTDRAIAAEARWLGIAGFLVWFGLTTLAFWINRANLTTSFDGVFTVEAARVQFSEHVSLLNGHMNILNGLGDVSSNPNFRLFPSFIIANNFAFSRAGIVLLFEWTLIELLVSSYFLARTLGLRTLPASAAGLFYCISVMPFFKNGLVMSNIFLIPEVGTIYAAASIMAALFVNVGRYRNWVSLACGLGVLLIVIWLVLASILTLIFIVPFSAVVIAAGLISVSGWRELLWKLSILILGAVLLLSGPVFYLAGLVLNSAAVFFPYELQNDRAIWSFVSILFQWETYGPVGPILVVFAIIGAVLSVADKEAPRTLRAFAFTLLTYLITRLLLGTLTVLFDFWRGPSPVYFELYALPLYSVFAVQAGQRLWARLATAIKITAWPIDFVKPALFTLAGILAVGCTFAKNEMYVLASPPPRTAPIDFLSEHIALERGAPFRGRVANMTGQRIDGPVTWMDLHINDLARAGVSGNEMRVPGLDYYRIPSIFEYTSAMTPAFYVLTTRFLARPRDRQMRSVSVLRNIDVPMLRQLGVRYVLTDKLVQTLGTPTFSSSENGHESNFYSLENPNLGTWSPVQTLLAKNATEVVTLMRQPLFDATTQVILAGRPVPTTLVKATVAEFSLVPSRIHLAASSPGTSMVLLPVEYSRCLKLSGDQGSATIVRANLLETGIIFKKKIDAYLSLSTGPFVSPLCRLRDRNDLKAMQIDRVPPTPVPSQGIPEAAKPPRRL